LYRVAILKYGSMVAECSVHKDIRSGKIAFLQTTFFQLTEQVLDGSGLDLQFFDAGVQPQKAIQFHSDHLIFSRFKVFSVGIPSSFQPRAL